MKIVVEREVRFEDVDNMREFAVVTELSLGELGARLRGAGLGDTRDGHAWIGADELGRHAGALSGDPDWSQQFAVMVDYARGAGWWDEASASIRAHIVPPLHSPGS